MGRRRVARKKAAEDDPAAGCNLGLVDPSQAWILGMNQANAMVAEM